MLGTVVRKTASKTNRSRKRLRLWVIKTEIEEHLIQNYFFLLLESSPCRAKPTIWREKKSSTRKMQSVNEQLFITILTCLLSNQISPSAASGKLSEKKYYPYFFRTLPALSSASKTFVRMARHFKWKQVAILYYSRELFVSVSRACPVLWSFAGLSLA